MRALPTVGGSFVPTGKTMRKVFHSFPAPLQLRLFFQTGRSRAPDLVSTEAIAFTHTFGAPAPSTLASTSSR